MAWHIRQAPGTIPCSHDCIQKKHLIHVLGMSHRRPSLESQLMHASYLDLRDCIITTMQPSGLEGVGSRPRWRHGFLQLSTSASTGNLRQAY